MRLTHVRVENFRSIENTGRFRIDDLTCLVGKNEAGKTAVLQALQGLLPHGKPQTVFDVTKEYPRRHVTKYGQRHGDGHGEVVHTWWELRNEDVEAVEAEFGDKVLRSRELEVIRYYRKGNLVWTLAIDETAAIEHLLAATDFTAEDREPLAGSTDSAQLVARLEAIASKTPRQAALAARLARYRGQSITYRIMDILSPRMPRFFYASHYDRMSGEISALALASQRMTNTVSVGDQIFLDFLDIAGTSLEELAKTKNYEDLAAKIESASNEITEQIFKYWTQNDALEVKIEFAEGKAGDPPPFNAGTVVRARVWNHLHRASVRFSERSAGFVWFFSFLVQFNAMKKTARNAIILLDEPGLNLHGKAQADLLRYIRAELLPDHQVIFTTHSPFMVPADDLSTVRLVQDVVRFRPDGRPDLQGTKVTEDLTAADPDTLFPLRVALGYDIARALASGAATLLVERPADVLYLQAFSDALKRRGRAGLDPRWTLCPAGGALNLHVVLTLFGHDTGDVAVLLNSGRAETADPPAWLNRAIAGAPRVVSLAGVLSRPRADVEDIFTTPLFARLLNLTYGLTGAREVTATTLAAAATADSGHAAQASAALGAGREPPIAFDAFTPAGWLIRKPAFLDSEDNDVRETLARAELCFRALGAPPAR